MTSVITVEEMTVGDGSSKPRSREVGLQGKLTVRIIRTLPELNDLRDLWCSWCQDPNADIDYYFVSAQHRGDILRPHVMIVYRDERPDCMLVGRLEQVRLKFKIGYKALFQPEARRLFFLQGGFIGNQSEENSRFLVREILSCLRQGEADIAELARIRQDSNLRRAAREEPSFFRRGHLCPMEERRSVKLPENYEAFVLGLSRKNRHEIRRHERKLAEDFPGKVRIRCYRGEHEVEDLAQEVDKISEKTYQRALGVGFKNDPELIGSLRVAARRGGLRGCVLYLEEQPCAFFIGNHYKDNFHGNFMGFDPNFGKYSPGLMILMHGIEECFAPNQRAAELDLGSGDRQYKRVLCNQSTQDGPAYLYAPSFKGLRLNLLGSFLLLIDHCARTLVEKNSLLQELKRTWQHRTLNEN